MWWRTTTSIMVCAGIVVCGLCGCDSGESDSQSAGVPQADAQGSPKVYWVELETSVGDIVIEVHRDWAPQGADHFYKLVESGFYSDCRFFRVIPDFMAQVGMNGDPLVQQKWEGQTISDDPVVESNQRGYVTFAKTAQPNSRSTQFFINFVDNSRLDSQGFSPFGMVVNGMDSVDKINGQYDQRPKQHRIAKFGNQYLNNEFPNLDYIIRARIIEEPTVKHPLETPPDAAGESSGSDAGTEDAGTEDAGTR